MNDTNTATIRTGWNATIIAIIGWIASNVFNWTLDLTDPIFILIVGVTVPVLYRASIALDEKWPILGKILFGRTATPTYGQLPPPVPPE